VLLQAAVEFAALRIGQGRHSLGIGGNAIPKVFGKLNSFGGRHCEKFGQITHAALLLQAM
jgi:hypothetical protein